MTRALRATALALALLARQLAAQDTLLVVQEVHGQRSPVVTALTFPVTVVLLPVRAVGAGLKTTTKWVEEHGVITRAARFFGAAGPFSAGLGGFGEHAGLGGGLRLDVGDRDGLSARFETGATLPGYQRHAATLRVRVSDAAALEAGAMYKVDTRDEFFGQGDTAVPADRADYRLTRVTAGGGLVARLSDHLVVEARVDWWRERAGGTPRNGLIPDLDARFAGRLPAGFGPTFTYLRPSLRAVADHVARTARGPVGAWASLEYAYDRGTGQADPRFHELEVETRGYVPLGGLRRTLAMRAVVQVRRTDRGPIPFYRLAAAGGSRGLRAFAPDRFRDANAALLTVEYRYRIWQDDRGRMGADLAVFSDAVALAPEPFTDFAFDRLHAGYGLALRLTGADVIARVEVARGPEGTRFMLKTGPLF
jgi:hypothetical protein